MPDYNGAAWFDYRIADSTSRTSTARVALTIAAVNDAPAIGALPVLGGTEDKPFSATFAPSMFTDVEGDVLLIDVQGQRGTALPGWLRFDRRTLTLTGTPPTDFNGALALEVIADDGQAITTKAVTLTIAAVNDAPVIAAATTAIGEHCRTYRGFRARRCPMSQAARSAFPIPTRATPTTRS